MKSTLAEFRKEMAEIGEKWSNGYKITGYHLNNKKIDLNPKQIQFVNDKTRYCLMAGGYGSGKSLALYIKLIMMALCYPDNTILLGRRHLSDITLTILPDLFDLMYKGWYKYKVKDGIIQFFNGSKVVLFGLDALQEGSMSDIKKAQQKLKSLNLGSFFIDQLEEIEQKVFQTLKSRLRKVGVPNQGNMTCNPANFWAYDYFKAHPAPDTSLIMTSMLDNKDHLPKGYLEDQLREDKNYVERYVYGHWTPELMTEKAVFAKEYIDRWKPVTPVIEEGCKIYEQPKPIRYQMGVDPSEGSVDPSSISVVSEEGKQVAVFDAKIPIASLGEKVKFLYEKYHHPLIIPEANAAGQALLLQIRDLKVFRRTVYDEKFDKETQKLGWKTTYQSKQALISNFQTLLRDGFIKVYDQGTINEFRTFVWTDSAQHKGAGAQRNYHDDDVISIMLACWGMSPKLIEKRKRRIEAMLSKPTKKTFQYF